jgi:DNA-binding beta-propeller fold protein YncE
MAIVDLRAGRVLQEVAVGREPNDIAIAGGLAYVTCEADDSLVAIDVEKGSVKCRLPTGQSPRSLIFAHTNQKLFFISRDASQLTWGDGVEKLAQFPIPRWPDRLTFEPASQDLIVASSHGGRTAVDHLSMRDSPRVIEHRELEDASNLRGMTMSSDGKMALLVHQRPKINIPTTQVVQGWVFTNAISLLPLLTANVLPLVGTVILDEPNRGFADPADVAVTPDGRLAFIACSGADTILALDLERVQNYLAKRVRNSEQYVAIDDLTASRHYVVAKLQTEANPRRLCVSGDGRTLVATNYLADSLSIIDVPALKVVRHIRLASAIPDAARRGEVLFNSGRMTFQGQFTCASCHPNGDADGLNWDLTRDGIGNFKNTKSLLGVRDTAPYGWEGSSPDLADRVRGTLRTLHRHEPTESEIADLVAYLRTLAPPRRLPERDADKSAIARGHAIFAGKGRCTECHNRVAFDDGLRHDIGTRGMGDTQDRFDTPSLLGVARTAPYLHDGRAETLEEVFRKFDEKKRHGTAHSLTIEELADLIAYLKSL